MCSISGFLKFGNNPITSKEIEKIMLNGESRGRDSFGYTIFSRNKRHRSYKYLGKVSDVLSDNHEFIFDPIDDYLLLNNNRAEPTTEFVSNKQLSDVQPYSFGETHIVHNGTIANDKELIQEYNLKLDTVIDSSVIAPIFDKCDFASDSIIDILQNKLIGSYALAVYNTKHKKLVLATNYKPLSILYNRKDDVLYFSSLEDYLVSSEYNRVFSEENLIEVEPYTCLIIDINTRDIKSYNLYKKKLGKQKALICASSGLDSTVAASWAKKQGYDITLLHFDYNCRASERERESIQNISNFFGCELVTIKADFFKNVLGGSRLYDGSDITKENEKGAELAIEWVPARNLIFLSIAAGYCEAKGIDKIILGGNLEESGAYSDNELIFQTKFGKLLPHALNLQTNVEVLTPVANLMKREIVQLGLNVEAPLHLTWSCYENGTVHCGKCGPCFMRKTAFKMLNVPEVIKYAE